MKYGELSPMGFSLSYINKLLIIICSFITFISAPAFGEPSQKLIFNNYINVRFGYSIAYPENIFIPQGESENGDGQRFLSKEGNAELVVSGVNNVLDETIATRYIQDSNSKTNEYHKKKVTYKYLGKIYYIVKGEQKGNIFYQKTMLKDNVFLTMYVTYPIDKNHDFAPIVSEISKTFIFVGTTARPN